MGHVALVETAFKALELPEIWVVPAGNPVHRKLSGRAGPEVRLHWLQRIFSQQPKARVQDWEIHGGKSVPTIETLRDIRHQFPDCRPVLLLGVDAFAGIHQWVEYPEHIALCDVAVFDRTGCSCVQRQGWRETSIRQWKNEAGSGRFLYVRYTLPDISATVVRQQAAEGKSLTGIVPDCVCEEIERAYLVRSPKE